MNVGIIKIPLKYRKITIPCAKKYKEIHTKYENIKISYVFEKRRGQNDQCNLNKENICYTICNIICSFQHLRIEHKDDMYRDMSEDWYRIAPISFTYERNTSRSRRINEELRNFYFEGGGSIDPTRRVSRV